MSLLTISRREREALPVSFVSNSDTPKYAGSVSNIYVGKIGDIACCVKIVPEHVSKAVAEDCSLVHLLGVMGSWMNRTLTDHLSNFETAVVNELDMRRELRMALKLNRALLNLKHPRLHVASVKALIPHCTPEAFVYAHETGVTLDQISCPDALNKCCEEVVICFFNLMHLHGLLLGDVNPGNFVVRSDGGIVLLDAGGAMDLGKTQMQWLHRLHTDKASQLGEVFHWLGVPGKVREFMTVQQLTFWSMEPSRCAAMPCIEELLQHTEVYTAELNPEFTLIFRACAQLGRLLRDLDVTICVGHDMRKLQDDIALLSESR